MRRLLTAAATASLLLAQAPVMAEGTADDIGVMSISLKDVVKPTIGFQGALQGAGTPNQAGIGGFLPLSVGENSVWFLDALVNANFGDRDDYSSIGDTLVTGSTLSTSTRLGYRWLNGDRSWMYGINGGYDTRQMATGGTTNDLPVINSQTVFFQQVAINAETKSKKWGASAYGLIPVGKYGYASNKVATINSGFGAEPLTTVGFDIGYNIFHDLSLTGGYYYQYCEKEPEKFKGYADGSGIKARLEYDITDQWQAGVVYSYDENFESRVTADLRLRFGGPKTTAMRKEVQQQPVIKALTATPSNRDVRVANSSSVWSRWQCGDRRFSRKWLGVKRCGFDWNVYVPGRDHNPGQEDDKDSSEVQPLTTR